MDGISTMSQQRKFLKLKTFAHTEFSEEKFSDAKIIRDKIDKKLIFLIEDTNMVSLMKFPDYLINNIYIYKEWLIKS